MSIVGPRTYNELDKIGEIRAWEEGLRRITIIWRG